MSRFGNIFRNFCCGLETSYEILLQLWNILRNFCDKLETLTFAVNLGIFLGEYRHFDLWNFKVSKKVKIHCFSSVPKIIEFTGIIWNFGYFLRKRKLNFSIFALQKQTFTEGGDIVVFFFFFKKHEIFEKIHRALA